MSPFRSWASGSSGGLAGPLEGAGVPELHRAHPVPGGDHPLEVAVIDGVVLGLDRQAAAAGVQGGSAGDRPGEQDAAVLEPEVVVETGRPVHLDAEATALREPVPEPSARSAAPPASAPLGSGVRVKSRLRRYSSRATTPRVGRSNRRNGLDLTPAATCPLVELNSQDTSAGRRPCPATPPPAGLLASLRDRLGVAASHRAEEPQLTQTTPSIAREFPDGDKPAARGRQGRGHPTPRPSSRPSRGWSRCAGGPGCTSARPTSAACTT